MSERRVIHTTLPEDDGNMQVTAKEPTFSERMASVGQAGIFGLVLLTTVILVPLVILLIVIINLSGSIIASILFEVLGHVLLRAYSSQGGYDLRLKTSVKVGAVGGAIVAIPFNLVYAFIEALVAPTVVTEEDAAAAPLLASETDRASLGGTAQLLNNSLKGTRRNPKNLAAEFINDDHVIFDLNNEPWGIPATDAAALMQAGINGIRSIGATQTIFVQGTSWTGAWTWESSGNAAAFKPISDPLNNTFLEMHQYFDTDGSGTNATCVSPTVGVERLTATTNWLKANGMKALLGEVGTGSNDGCITAVRDALCYMQQSGVWVGAAWWAAGPWWGNYFQSIEPPNGAAVARILPEALLPFV
ncbi:hypothetical protein FRC17_009289 [Serendipita sp. 399]|nr:hypothetical protein FRC17_009289 [Serendipita sp. 399]